MQKIYYEKGKPAGIEWTTPRQIDWITWAAMTALSSLTTMVIILYFFGRRSR